MTTVILLVLFFKSARINLGNCKLRNRQNIEVKIMNKTFTIRAQISTKPY